jgi:hypothetical protein
MFFIINNTPYALLLRLARLSTPLLLREREQKALHFPAKTTDEDRHLALRFPKYRSSTAEIVVGDGMFSSQRLFLFVRFLVFGFWVFFLLFAACSFYCS